MSLEKWTWPNVGKDLWGPRGWYWLHNLAIQYPQTPSKEDARLAAARLNNFIDHLPCPECLAHSKAFILNNPVNLTNTYAFQHWVWVFHNTVNLMLNKPLVPYEEYLHDYADEISQASGCMY